MKALLLEAEWSPKSDYQLSEFEKETGKAITGNSVWKNPQLRIQEVEEPSIQPDEVLIKVKACGVCGSDLHFYETDKDNYILYPGLTKFPCILGHEFSGLVEEVGEAVKGLKPGDLVTAEEMIWCGKCRPCRDGFPNQCLNLEEIGFTINGAFAEYIAVGEKYCWKIDELAERYTDEDKAFLAGATVEPTAVAYNGIFECAKGFKPGGYVVIYGAGPIGLSAISLCKASGAARVIAFETSEKRRKLAEMMGADDVYNPENLSPSEVVLEITRGEGADMQIEAAGVPQKTIPEMEKSIAFGGKVVQIGRAAEKVPIYLESFQVRKASAYGAQGHSGYGTFPHVIRLMASGLIDTTKMITKIYDLEKAVEAIASLSGRDEGKVVIRP